MTKKETAACKVLDKKKIKKPPRLVLGPSNSVRSADLKRGAGAEGPREKARSAPLQDLKANQTLENNQEMERQARVGGMRSL